MKLFAQLEDLRTEITEHEKIEADKQVTQLQTMERLE